MAKAAGEQDFFLLAHGKFRHIFCELRALEIKLSQNRFEQGDINFAFCGKVVCAAGKKRHILRHIRHGQSAADFKCARMCNGLAD